MGGSLGYPAVQHGEGSHPSPPEYSYGEGDTGGSVGPVKGYPTASKPREQPWGEG
jgi:hypothetical protein